MTDGIAISAGTYSGVYSGNAGNPLSVGGGLLEAGKTYRIESRCTIAGGAPAGAPFSQGTEVYARVLIWRR